MLMHRTVAMFFCLFALASVAAAAPIGYWRFETGPDGAAATTATSAVNSPALNGTFVGTAGAFKYSADVPPGTIFDGANGPSSINNLSVKTTQAAGNRFEVNGTLTRPTNFTYETFIKADNSNEDGYQIIARKGTSWWLMKLDDNLAGLENNLRLRVDTPGFADQHVDFDVDLMDNDLWHHVAVTYDDSLTSDNFKLYYDYEQVGTLTPGGNGGKILYDNAALQIGGYTGNGWNGWIDEARLSDQVLSPDQFLRVPEPGSLALWTLVAMIGLALFGWRRVARRAV